MGLLSTIMYQSRLFINKATAMYTLDMSEKRLVFNNWSGGMSDDEKFALYPGAASFNKALDFRHDLSRLVPHRKTVKESGSVVTTEPYHAVSTNINNGDMYVAGGTKLYKRTPGSNGATGTYSEIVTSGITSIRDLDYRQDLDTLFCLDEQAIHAYAPLLGVPVWLPNAYQTTTPVSNSGTGATYALPAALSETAVNTLSFTAKSEPVYSIVFNVDAKGTGDWLVTLHDNLNNVVSAKSIANASLPASGTVEFTLLKNSLPPRITLNAQYHIHLFSTDGTGTIVSSTANDIRTANWSYKSPYLIYAGEFGHYTLQFGNKTLIGNERYLAEIEYGAVYKPHRLVFPPDAIVNGITKLNQYAAITAARRTNSDSLTGNAMGSGYIFLWDGASVFYESEILVPYGIPWNPIASDNALQFVANGRVYEWAGGEIEPKYEFHGFDEFSAGSGKPALDLYARAARHASTGRDSLTLFGFPHTSANPNLKVGVYSFGSGKMAMPKVASLDYEISTGHDTVQWNEATTPDTPITGVTMVTQAGANLLIGWKDIVSGSTTYGIDLVNDANGYAASGSRETLWLDDDDPNKDKLALAVRVRTKALPTGATVTAKIRYDRSDTWTYGDAAVAGATSAKLIIDPARSRYKEAMVGFDYANPSGNKIEIISMTFKFDNLEEEQADTEAD